MGNTQQIGKAGELLVQYKLLKLGIDSSHMTTDAGIDLVVYIPNKRKAVTIQVKTNAKAKPAGGNGSPSIGWFVEDVCPADMIALVYLEDNKGWLFSRKEFNHYAQQHSKSGIRQLYMYLNDDVNTSKKKALHIQFDNFLIERRIKKLFK